MKFSAWIVPASLALVAAAAGCSSGGTPSDVVGGNDAVADTGGTSGDTGTDGGAAVAYTRYTEGALPATVTWVDACAMGTRVPMGSQADSLNSENMGPLTTPFPIHLYAGTYTTAHVSTNGWLAFSQFLLNSAPRRAQGTETLPSFEAPNAAVYPLWQDLAMRDDNSICAATVGTAPRRSFVIEWSNLYFENNTTPDGNLTFEVALNEDDTIDVLYQTITPGTGRADALTGVTIGVENEEMVAGMGTGGSRATQSHVTPASGGGMRFTPMM